MILMMNIKTELPTDPGAYWWRRHNTDPWDLRHIRPTDIPYMGAYNNGSGVGFWVRIQTPDEAASDPVMVAALKALEILNGMGYLERAMRLV